MEPLSIFLLGCAGALAPEVVRLYGIRSRPRQFKWSWFYIVISLLFACLGGLLALTLPATTYWGAVYAGISTPVLVNTVLRKALEKPEVRSLTPPKLPVSMRSFVAGL